VQWTTDNMVQKITEPTSLYSQFTYNQNGYLTDTNDQLNNHTTISYQDQAVDGNDTTLHLSRVTSVVQPVGNAIPSHPTDYKTSSPSASAGSRRRRLWLALPNVHEPRRLPAGRKRTARTRRAVRGSCGYSSN